MNPKLSTQKHKRRNDDYVHDTSREADEMSRKVLADRDRKELVDAIVSRTLNVIQEEDFQRVRGLFEQMDADHSGTLTSHDFVSHAKRQGYDVARAESFFQEITNKMDFDGDGTVSFGEFLKYFVIKALFDPMRARVPSFTPEKLSGDIFLILFFEFRTAFTSTVWEFESSMKKA